MSHFLQLNLALKFPVTKAKRKHSFHFSFTDLTQTCYFHFAKQETWERM